MRAFYFSLTILVVCSLFACQSIDPPPTYDLATNVIPEEAGTIDPALGTYERGTKLNITAKPAENYVFDYWEGNVDRTTNPAEITVNGHTQITAVFMLRDYPLTINTVGEGTVTEQLVSSAKTEYRHGTTVG